LHLSGGYLHVPFYLTALKKQASKVFKLQRFNPARHFLKDRTRHIRNVNLQLLVPSDQREDDVGTIELPKHVFLCKTQLNAFNST